MEIIEEENVTMCKTITLLMCIIDRTLEISH